MLSKAKRELRRLEIEEGNIDHAYNFFATAYHIVDYLKGRLSQSEIDKILADPLIKLCADACNKAKHMKLTRGRPDIRTDVHSATFGSFTFNTMAFNTLAERWITWEDGTRLEVVGFAQGVIARWEEIFAEHGI